MNSKSDKVLEGAAVWGAFYRKNPQRFVADYLNIYLKTFQKILIYLLLNCTNGLIVASRGIGKTWLLALYCIIRCILYPGTKICVTSGTKGQAIEVLEKIEKEFLINYGWGSSNLKREIKNLNTGVNTAQCEFMNGSWIKVVTSTDNARHNRANVIIVDEYRMVAKDIIDTVIRKFKSAPRQPGYLKNPEYAHLAERNCELYASSAYYKAHWAYDKVRSYFANMLDDKRKYLCLGFPYQLAIMEGLLMPEEVEDEMSEEDFDEIAWYMEMCAFWYGASGEAFFDYDDLTAQRKIKNSYLPLFMYEKRGINIPELLPNERRILAVDVALMATKKHKNDAASLSLNVALPTESNYISNFVYMETKEGLTTDELGMLIMKMFYGYKCTDLVLDTGGKKLPLLIVMSRVKCGIKLGA